MDFKAAGAQALPQQPSTSLIGVARGIDRGDAPQRLGQFNQVRLPGRDVRQQRFNFKGWGSAHRDYLYVAAMCSQAAMPIYAAPLLAEQQRVHWVSLSLAPLSLFSDYDPPVPPVALTGPWAHAMPPFTMNAMPPIIFFSCASARSASRWRIRSAKIAS